jgi:hypothetical protein
MAEGLIIGRKDVVHFEKCRYWADRGLIHWEKDDGDYGSMPVKDALERMRGLSDMVGNIKHGEGYHYASEVSDHQTFIEQMVAIVRRAREQGEPIDAEARRDAKRRRPLTVVLPKLTNRGVF